LPLRWISIAVIPAARMLRTIAGGTAPAACHALHKRRSARDRSARSSISTRRIAPLLQLIQPPSITWIAPVVKLDSSLAR
jgi:hypothetical protein